MALDQAQLEKLLCERLCAEVRIHRREDDVMMMESPFVFPDGDHFPIYLSETPTGSVKLSDLGHTLMHVSYDHEVDSFYEGARASLREQIVRESGIEEDDGIFSVETPPDQVAGALFRLGQALTKIHDLTFLSRERVTSTFYEDLSGLVFTILDEEVVETDYMPPDVPDANHYPVDYRFEGKDGRSVFLYGILGRDKARLTTIMLSHFLLHHVPFESIIVFADQQEIPRLDLARLTNVAGTAVASLEAEEDLRRKIECLAA
ncbi:MAG: DUF1828 domain-containing protein [Rhodospirillaceae bacterium]|nr:DUF1828 domain-containing protein [Rhodospirillaceae bacterium]